MGCMRSSNWADGLNFHLRMIVQMITAPPMQDAMTIITVTVVFVTEDEEDALLVSADDAVSVSADDVSVPVMVRVMFSSGRTVVRTFA